MWLLLTDLPRPKLTEAGTRIGSEADVLLRAIDIGTAVTGTPALADTSGMAETSGVAEASGTSEASGTFGSDGALGAFGAGEDETLEAEVEAGGAVGVIGVDVINRTGGTVGEGLADGVDGVAGAEDDPGVEQEAEVDSESELSPEWSFWRLSSFDFFLEEVDGYGN